MSLPRLVVLPHHKKIDRLLIGLISTLLCHVLGPRVALDLPLILKRFFNTHNRRIRISRATRDSNALALITRRVDDRPMSSESNSLV